MKRIVLCILILTMTFALFGCGSASAAPAKTEAAANGAASNPDDLIDNPAWDDLKEEGRIVTEKGVDYFSLTLSEDFVGEGTTQKTINERAGVLYTSGKLNKDGTVTYKMTKSQHKMMLDSYAATIEKELVGMVKDYSFSKISHNNDYTVFDAYLTTGQLEFAESLTALSFYLWGGLYNMYAGHQGKEIIVHYYAANGNLINTSSSAEMA